MDFLKKAGNFLGNAAYQAAKFVPGVGNVIRSYEQVSKNTNLARQQAANRYQQQNRPVPQQLRQAPQPRLNYNAAMSALNALKSGAGNVANFVAPNTTKFAGQALNTAQATQMRLNQISRQLTGQKIAPGDAGRIRQLEAGGFVPQNVRQGTATPLQFAGAAFKTGAPVGIEAASFGKGISTANLGIRQAAPALVKQGVAFGGAQTANNLAFGEGDFKQRLKNLPMDALNNVAGNVGGQFLGYGLGRAGTAISDRLRSPATNVGIAGMGLVQRPGSKVRIDPKTGKKVFAPQYNPGGKATNSGLQADNYNRDFIGKFSKKQASSEGTTRVISERELNYFNKNGELPANPEGYTNIIKPGEINNIKGITDSKKYLVKLKDGVKIDSESGPQFAVKGGIDGKYVAEIAPYVKSADRVPVLSKKFNDSMYADGAIGNDVPNSAFKQDPLDSLKIEDRLKSKYPGVDFSVYDNGRTINVSKIVVPKTARNSGIGTKAMQEIISEADRSGKTITLTPSGDYGGSKVRLKEFYKRLGFAENKGRTKDLAISEDMYRLPTNKSQGVRDSLADGLPNPGRKPIISDADPLDSLKAEARKYKSAEEFVNSQVSRPKTTDNVWQDILPSGTRPDSIKKIVKSGGNPLYHDTTADGVLGILDSGKIKASQAPFSSLAGQGKRVSTTRNFDNYSRYNKSPYRLVVDESKAGQRAIPDNREEFESIFRKEVPTKAVNSIAIDTTNPALLADIRSGKLKNVIESAKKKGITIEPFEGKILPNEGANAEVQTMTSRAFSEAFPEYKTRISQLTDLYNQAKPKVKLKGDDSMYGPGAIGNDIPKSVAAQLDAATPKVAGLKDRGFVKSVQGDFGVPSELSDALPKAYKPIKNAETFNTAKQIVDSDPSALNKLLSKPKNEITSVDQAQAQILLRRAIDDDNIKLAQRIATKVDVNAREAGRTVQILAAWKKTTPEGAFSQANKIIDEANSKLPANKQLVLTKDMTAKLKGLAEKVQSETIGTREHDVASALLEKELRELVPPSLGRKLSTIQSMAQLLNPKTAIRNLGGNSLFAGLENVSTTVGTGVDKVIGLGTKQRSVALPSYMTQIKGFIKGGKHGIEDTKLGIKTSGMAGQFEVQPSIFKSAIMKKLERVMGYELSVPDKAFYQAAFDDSLRNQMKAMKIAKPNAMLVDAANKEALYKTFQNNSKIAEVLSSGKKALNTIGINNKEFGLGDVVMKYPKTPGNILSSGIDYAGGGIVKGVAGLVRGARSGGITQGAQREAALNIGRGVTGLGLVGSGYGLAKAGVVTSDPNKDKDVMALERAAGQGPYNLNLSGLQRLLGGGDTRVKQGDLNANYDWLQPASLPFTIGANIGTKQKAGDATANVIDSVNASINTVTEQPVLAGLNRFFSGVAGKQANPTQALQNAVQGAPASFIPSIVNQIGQKDPYSRNTYDPNYLQGMLNQAKAKVPGLREGLQPRLDTFGNPTKQYEDNNFFNVFLNPAFTKHYNLTPEAKLVLDVNKGSGETSQFPRVAPYSTQVNGQKVELSGEQLRKFQEYTGLKTKTAYQQMVNDPKFQSLSDTDKAKRMSDVLTNVAAAAKIDVLGDKVDKNTSKDVKNIVSKGQVKYNNSSVSSGASTPSNPQERYQKALEQYNQDQADGKISAITSMSKESALDRLKVQSNFDQDTVDLYSQSKANIDKYLKGQRKGGDLLNKLVALDDALVASGHTSKLRNSKGEISITPKIKLSKAAGGKRAKTRQPKFTSTRSRGISRVRAKGAPKIKFAKLPSGGKSTKIKV